jgi:2-polyprenyl-3-methyl-5-hydroxy-6-metoxy-1,4-benzoquinol methylase
LLLLPGIVTSYCRRIQGNVCKKVRDMSVSLDPEEAETRTIHSLIDFTDRDVLDVGCGDGRLTWRFAPATHSVLGIDPSAEAIATAKASTPAGLSRKAPSRCRM